ncbi:MAG: DUF2442 domain-containing protein [Bacteroidetes bacterium]|nr:MAG: DUF2442 domain-containing protein [Bacteroidota bacterium]
MRTIVSYKEIDRLQLIFTFDDHSEKKIDLTPYVNSEVFGFLKDKEASYAIKNEKYHLEWYPFDADLSADTLWHIGV